MPTRLFDALPLLVSTAVAAWIGLHVARSIRKTGVEHYSGRILILAAITNTVIVALMLLLLSAAALRTALTHDGFNVADLTLGILLLILPVSAVWNYIKTPVRIMRRLGLTSVRIEEHSVEVAAVASAMGVTEPSILSSPRCRMPFVFGRDSKHTHLALPDTWSTVDARSRSIMLCHELAHIRNRDVGFLTWSVAFLNDLKWALLLSPIVMALSLLGGQAHLPRAAVLYVACLLILWILTNTVVRSRELLADATVAMLIDSGEIARTLDEILLVPETGVYLRDTGSSGVVFRITDWVADKAMFSRHAAFWKPMARFTEMALATHPSVSVRRQAIHRERTATADSVVDKGQAFWAGLTLGLFAVLIALGGFWTGKYILGWDDDEQIVLLSYDCWGDTAPLAGVFIALLSVLPAWSSLQPRPSTGRNLVRLLSQYVYALLAACCVLPLVLLGGWSHIEIKLLLVLGIMWVFVVLTIGLVTNIVMLNLWLSLRYRRRAFFINLPWILYSCGMGLVGIFCYFTYGLVLMSGGQTLAGGSLVFGLLIGLAVFMATGKESQVSGRDQYMVITSPRMPVALEGKAYRRWSPLAGSLHTIGMCLIPATVVSALIYRVADWTLGHIEDPTAIIVLLLLALGCSILLFFDRRWPRRMHQVGRQKIYALMESQILLGRQPSTESSTVMDKVFESLQIHCSKCRSFGIMTTQKMFELAMLASRCERLGGWIGEYTRQWAVNCETSTGFGVWPSSGTRLSSTYQCLRTLQQTGGMPRSDPSHHVAWIRGLQTSDGSFQGPWSHRPRWEDTFHAVAALNMLGSVLDSATKDRCLKWIGRTLTREGIDKGQLDAFHHCLAAADALQGMDEDLLRTASRWLSLELDRLLLTHVAHNAENIHHAVCAYHILRERGASVSHPEQIALLADRINDALEAELAALRI